MECAQIPDEKNGASMTFLVEVPAPGRICGAPIHGHRRGCRGEKIEIVASEMTLIADREDLVPMVRANDIEDRALARRRVDDVDGMCRGDDLDGECRGTVKQLLHGRR